MSRFTDTHCHLNLNSFQDDLDQVIARAQNQGVNQILIPGVDLQTSQSAIELAEKYEFIFAAVGVHPNDAATWTEEVSSKLEEMAAHPKVVAIGEIGLDYYWNKNSLIEQRQILEAQLEIANRVQKPIILHSRQAILELMEIMVNWQKSLDAQGSLLAKRPGVFHAFEGNMQQLDILFQANFLIGLGGPVTFKNAVEKHSVAQNAPLEAILLETDAPYLSPLPHRGERNEPAYIPLIADKIAVLRNQPLDLIEKGTTRNADRLFLWRTVS